ncbi:MAG: hypothetical protein KKA42_01845 [candidate division Zixibacteria bacterium]|nr:hypothetical protein [candidate division Zixibacteria bacterium]
MKRFKDTFGFAVILNLLLPGLGHVFWRDYLFGVFVFLILLIAVALMFVSFLVSLPLTAKLVLFGLPVLFFAFTFVDLSKTVNRRFHNSRRSRTAAFAFLGSVLAFQLLVPFTPGNFLLRNRPELFRQPDHHLSPLHSKGDLLVTNRMAYTVDLFFAERPLLHDLPRVGEIVRFDDRQSVRRTGLVLGPPGSDVQMIDGQLVIDGSTVSPAVLESLNLNGDMPLTLVEQASILVVTLTLGAVDGVYQVPVDHLVGRVDQLF